MNIIETIKKNRHRFLLTTIGILLLILNYFYEFTKEIKILNLGLIITIMFFVYKIKYLKKFIEYLKNAKNEIKNITWPKLQDVKQSTFAVLIIVIITSLIIWIIDSILTYIITYIIKG